MGVRIMNKKGDINDVEVGGLIDKGHIFTIFIIAVIIYAGVKVGVNMLGYYDNYIAYCDEKFGKDNWHSEYNYTIFALPPQDVYSCVEGGLK